MKRVKSRQRCKGSQAVPEGTVRACCEDLERFHEIYQSVNEFIYEHDMEGAFLGISPFFVGFLGYGRDELLSMNVKDLLLDKDRVRFHEYIQRLGDNGRDEGLIQLVTRTGRKRIVEHKTKLLTGPDGAVSVCGIAKDVTDMLEAEQALVESEIRFRTILDSIEDGYFEVDLMGNFTFFNDIVPRQSGYTADELIGMNYKKYMDVENARRVFEAFHNVFITGTPTKAVDWELIRKDGERIYVEASVSLQKDRNDRPMGFCGIIRDITERKRSERELAYLAYHDALTGLHNRKAFHEKLDEVIKDARRYGVERSILYIDLDHFKRVNDVFGHDMGDRLLMQVSSRLRGILRETDYISRLGGDEFTVILGGISRSDPVRVAQRVLKSLSKPYQFHDVVIDFVTPSIGISTFPDDGHDGDTILKHADDAMYRAKRQRNSYCLYRDHAGKAGTAEATEVS
jgi:diguanylate cyclase (GGDEF)-like protein/PAS domain S-box-containing protein